MFDLISPDLPKASRWRKLGFVYFLFNFGVPVFMSDQPFGCFVYAKRLSDDWSKPLPDGCLTCIGYRPGVEPGVDLETIDLSDQILKLINND